MWEKRERRLERQKERETASVLDIARGSVQHWRTSPWSTTVATPNLFKFSQSLSLSRSGGPTPFIYIPFNVSRVLFNRYAYLYASRREIFYYLINICFS